MARTPAAGDAAASCAAPPSSGTARPRRPLRSRPQPTGAVRSRARHRRGTRRASGSAPLGPASAGPVGTAPRARPRAALLAHRPLAVARQSPDAVDSRHARHRSPTCDGGRCSLATGPGALACRHTFTNRCAPVSDVSASITQSTGTSAPGIANPAANATIRSARSINPPLALNPSASARARSYEINIEVPITAIGSSGSSPPPPSMTARCQAMPPSNKPSATRSATESKNAPRGDAVPDAFATAPSSRSGTAASASSTAPRKSRPLPMATAVPAAMTTPVAVRWSAVMPIRRMAEPTGAMPRSTLVRQRPSNTSWLLRRRLIPPPTVPQALDNLRQ